jgi:hypothetical protein
LALAASCVVAGVGATSQAAESAPTRAAPLTQSQHAALEINTVAVCLKAQGWSVEVDEQGALDASVPFEHADAYDAADRRCREEFLAAHPRPVLGKGAFVTLFKHQLFLVECLKAKGYAPVQHIPTEAEYVAAGLSGRSPDFYAWSAVGNVGPSEAASIEQDCPQAPPGL